MSDDDNDDNLEEEVLEDDDYDDAEGDVLNTSLDKATVATAVTTKTTVSQLTGGSEVYTKPGGGGHMHRKHKNPREKKSECGRTWYGQQWYGRTRCGQ